jgi:hypothetical protein
MIVVKGSIEHQPVEFDGNVYGGAGDAIVSETVEGLIDLMKGTGALPLKAGEKLIVEAVEMSQEEFASIPDYNG